MTDSPSGQPPVAKIAGTSDSANVPIVNVAAAADALITFNFTPLEQRYMMSHRTAVATTSPRSPGTDQSTHLGSRSHSPSTSSLISEGAADVAKLTEVESIELQQQDPRSSSSSRSTPAQRVSRPLLGADIRQPNLPRDDDGSAADAIPPEHRDDTDIAKERAEAIFTTWLTDAGNNIQAADGAGQIQRGRSTIIADVEQILQLESTVEQTDPKIIHDRIDVAQREIIGTVQLLHHTLLIEDPEISSKMRLVINKLCAVKELLSVLQKCKAANTDNGMNSCSGGMGLFRLLDSNSLQKPTPQMQLVTWCIVQAAQLGFRRYKGDFYEPILSSQGQITCAWKKRCSISEFLWAQTADTTSEIYGTLIRNHTIEDASKVLSHSQEMMCMQLVFNRHTFSFDNGVYLADKRLFIPWAEMAIKTSQHTFPVACKHFPVVIDPSWVDESVDLHTIPTPAFDKICRDQELSPDLVDWFMVLLGRLLYNIGEFDDWQVMLFIRGLGNTGKSTLMNFLVGNFYQVDQVGIVSNNIEEKFGLGSLIDKFIVLLDDIRENFKMDQSDFQNALSGLNVSCAIKHENPKVGVWRAPMAGAGNEFPGFRDNSGSYSRRMAVICFKKMLVSPDGSLRDQIIQEAAPMIIKANRAYRTVLDKFGQKGFWTFAPKEMMAERSAITESSNYLSSFLDSGILDYGPNFSMSYDDFSILLKLYAAQNNFTGRLSAMTANFYQMPFQSHKISLSNQPMIINGKTVTRVVRGCRPVSASIATSIPSKSTPAPQHPHQQRRCSDANAADLFDEEGEGGAMANDENRAGQENSMHHQQQIPPAQSRIRGENAAGDDDILSASQAKKRKT